ncbi:MAG: SPOR domain-containing protein [Paludibacteraceae bacterium]|jgi:hypothetical protein|nr:SPOR domain-containing protein [Paludibacteraceae bacterium]
MKRTLILILCIAFSALSISVIAQDNYDMQLATDSILVQEDSVEVKLSTRDYLNLLMTPDPLTGAVMNIYQDSVIFAAIEKKAILEAEEVKGFRIQIFSSNRGASARERAFEIKEILVSKHPNLADEIYITYTSPFWKVRVGNCQTNAKAQELRQWIIAEFPEFTTETYIVPSMIYVY